MTRDSQWRGSKDRTDLLWCSAASCDHRGPTLPAFHLAGGIVRRSLAMARQVVLDRALDKSEGSRAFTSCPRFRPSPNKPGTMLLLSFVYVVEVLTGVVIKFRLDLSSYLPHFFDNRIFHVRDSTISSQPQQHCRMRDLRA